MQRSTSSVASDIPTEALNMDSIDDDEEQEEEEEDRVFFAHVDDSSDVDIDDDDDDYDDSDGFERDTEGFWYMNLDLMWPSARRAARERADISCQRALRELVNHYSTNLIDRTSQRANNDVSNDVRMRERSSDVSFNGDDDDSSSSSNSVNNNHSYNDVTNDQYALAYLGIFVDVSQHPPNLSAPLFTSLRQLVLRHGSLDSLSGLAFMPHLRVIDVTDNRLMCMSGIDASMVPQLTYLIADKNPLATLGPAVNALARLEHVEYLSFRECPISNLWSTLAALHGMRSLRHLRIFSLIHNTGQYYRIATERATTLNVGMEINSGITNNEKQTWPYTWINITDAIQDNFSEGDMIHGRAHFNENLHDSTSLFGLRINVPQHCTSILAVCWPSDGGPFVDSLNNESWAWGPPSSPSGQSNDVSYDNEDGNGSMITEVAVNRRPLRSRFRRPVSVMSQHAHKFMAHRLNGQLLTLDGIPLPSAEIAADDYATHWETNPHGISDIASTHCRIPRTIAMREVNCTDKLLLPSSRRCRLRRQDKNDLSEPSSISNTPSMTSVSVSTAGDDDNKLRSIWSVGLTRQCLFTRSFEITMMRDVAMKGAFYHHLIQVPGFPLPRQFEYSHMLPNSMVYGTVLGHLVVLNPNISSGQGSSIAVTPASIAWKGMSRISSDLHILGLSWLRNDPNHFLAGCSGGFISLFNTRKLQKAQMSGFSLPIESIPFPPFDALTSLHVNSTDRYAICSGYSKDVRLYDINTGRSLETFPDLHKMHINVTKFSFHSPHLFATASFDRMIKVWDLRQPINKNASVFSAESRGGNVMICWSPNDQYLLSSAIDNDVRQYAFGDKRLYMQLPLPRRQSFHNYSRSYYMNHGDYIISGSCEESCVRVINASTGRVLVEVDMQQLLPSSCHNLGSYVQSLRGNPHLDYNFAVLVNTTPVQSSMIIGVDLMRRCMDAP